MARRRLSSSVTLATLASAAWSCATVGAAAGFSLAAAAGSLCATAKLSGTGSGKAVPVAAEEGSVSACPMASSASCWATSCSCAARRSWLRASSESMTDCIVSEAAGPGAGSSTGSSAGSRAVRLAATAMARAMIVARSIGQKTAMPSLGNYISTYIVKTADKRPHLAAWNTDKRDDNLYAEGRARETHGSGAGAQHVPLCRLYVAGARWAPGSPVVLP